MGFLQTHDQVLQVSYMLEMSSTSSWQVGSHCWAFEQFSGLEVVAQGLRSSHHALGRR